MFPRDSAGLARAGRSAFVTVVPGFYVRTAQPVEHRDTIGGWQRLIAASGLDVLRVEEIGARRSSKEPPTVRHRARLGLAWSKGGALACDIQFIFVLRKP